ncbi:polyphosphate polymerase domain-containing protein [Dactylosporangium roseum]|uniref:Polyphosphate polymerase domain-containing protein n=1 Tax=Dactylosporangium roseum TaxID=47989 RepID=A0ABY5YWT9_9ACTN|nr:polyphosphate polymerase domain-containing protein [Dactylosporangium roseum]UWZ34223.1 polyphosphate polymerase domain-containing protein [Dactylosporangium roseum]
MTTAEQALRQALTGLPPVSLADVTSAAALLTRVDRKYLLPARSAGAFVAALGAGVTALEIDGRRLFEYDSVYFDTADLDTYRAHLQRRRRRYKVRTRSYLDSGECLLEVKLKGARGVTVKQRLRYPFADRERLTGAGLGFVREALGDAYQITPPALGPVLRTRYRRATLVTDDRSTRLTCDVGLVCSADDWSGAQWRGRSSWARLEGRAAAAERRPPDRLAPGLRDHVLVEVKSANQSTPVDRILRGLGVRPAVMSKYCVAVAMLHPGLPANPWHRTLRTVAGRDSRGGVARDHRPH